MQKMTLNLEAIEVVSFEPLPPDDANDPAAISGQACVTWRTVYGTCCTP